MVNGKVWLVLVFCAAAITEARHGSNRSGASVMILILILRWFLFCRANEVDLDQCQVRLYRHQYFRGPLPVITRDRKRLKGLEKSIRTIGKGNSHAGEQ